MMRLIIIILMPTILVESHPNLQSNLFKKISNLQNFILKDNDEPNSETAINGLNHYNSDDNIIYNKIYFEGDIYPESITGVGYLNAVRNNNRWRNGRIPYTISDEYSAENKSLIASVIDDYHNRTCVRFAPKRWSDFSHIHIYPGYGCASQVGKLFGKQYLSLASECLRFGIIQHELMHAIGFWHEQSRPDRDEYVRVNWENIEKGLEGNFVKLTWSEIQTLGEPYDYGSIMHYGTHAFANSFGPTLSPLKEVPKDVLIGQRRALSEIDLRKINKLYACESKTLVGKLIDRLVKIINELNI